jgi:hypothetical protein
MTHSIYAEPFRPSAPKRKTSEATGLSCSLCDTFHHRFKDSEDTVHLENSQQCEVYHLAQLTARLFI